MLDQNHLYVYPTEYTSADKDSITIRVILRNSTNIQSHIQSLFELCSFLGFFFKADNVMPRFTVKQHTLHVEIMPEFRPPRTIGGHVRQRTAFWH